MRYSEILSPTIIPQSEPLNERMIPNSTGGYAYQVTDWTQLERFLILGSCGGNYYFSERDLSKKNLDAVLRCISKDGPKVVAMISDVSVRGRGIKNDPAIFALALCVRHGDANTRQAAYEAIPKVCRIGTHLLNFVEECDGLGKGFGRGMKRGVASWFTSKTDDQLAYQAIKYASRGKWSLKDVLRVSHPKIGDNPVYQWILKGTHCDVPILAARDVVHELPNANFLSIIKTIRDYNLPREALPTEMLNRKEVWDALLDKMPLTAMIRNLGKMSSIGLIDPMSEGEKKVCMALGNAVAIRNARVRPLAILTALSVYRMGRGIKGSLTWEPSSAVLYALSEAVALAMEHAPATGLKTLVAIDVSRSMHTTVAGANLTTHEAAGCMAVSAMKSEPYCDVIAFSSAGHLNGPLGWVGIDVKGRRLDDVVTALGSLSGGTDLSIPIRAALNMPPLDLITIYTDSETWAGNMHMEAALDVYRKKVNPAVKVAVISLTANSTSVGDPNDPNVLQAVGFDASLPQVLAAFAGGSLPDSLED